MAFLPLSTCRRCVTTRPRQIYAFDATTIDLCLSVYPWAPFRAHKAAIKLHTLLDLRGSIRRFLHITDGKVHEVNTLDLLHIESGAFFVTRAKSNTKFKRRYSNPVDRASSSIVFDQTGVLSIFSSNKDYPAPLRRVVAKEDRGKRVTFLTNNFALKPELIAIAKKSLHLPSSHHEIL